MKNKKLIINNFKTKGLAWTEIALWVLALALLLFFLFFSGVLRDKMINAIKIFFNLRP